MHACMHASLTSDICACSGAGGAEPEGPGVVSAMWEGVARMTQMARDTTHSFLDASAMLGPHPPAGAACGLAGARTKRLHDSCRNVAGCWVGIFLHLRCADNPARMCWYMRNGSTSTLPRCNATK